ncbi:proteasomal ubiquitin receptor ADRM1-like [Gigantopelta aegis]|uniref:proteasomal ubiquitin receptor ADRM1-like n=1 Tax=Gigantopelta aegis TaxID=1735272 RepID=UPI001B88C903|nr:proteasomal ubiquitin receptor ADRM1-like [Gigantopelta aegis]
MAALFGSSTNRSQSKNLVEFRAGKMHMKGNMVHPDKRKGLVYVYQSDDSLMHFCWKDRTSGNVDDDLIIFPDDIEFKSVKQCKTGRVFVLKFKSSTRKFFFWMQEPKLDKDEDYCKKVNEFLNNPPTPGSNRSGASLPSELSGLGDSDLQNILGGMSQQQLMQLLGGMGMSGPGSLSSLMGRPGSAQSTVSEPPLRAQTTTGTRTTNSGEVTPTQPRPVTAAALPSQPGSTTTTAVTTSTTTPTPTAQAAAATTPRIQLSDLQNILSTMNVPSDAPKESIDLSVALSPESMIPILANSEIQAKLIPFLPEGESLPKTEAELRNTIQSPQFQQALTSFSAALQSGQLGPLMNQFNLGEDVANSAAQGDLEAFVKAMQEEMKKEGSKKEKADTDDEKMEH